ncbi:alpha-hydroxy-acid oxidizing protein, partial [Salmonella enterica subsp. enterica serovar Cerro]|nr:alpha-hydroxy-acid oxidizing protein [Salmonella enterica subsp. enterica serovar Cerro]
LIHASATPPSVLISGSATGYYGDLGDVVVTEDEPPHNEFTHKQGIELKEIDLSTQLLGIPLKTPIIQAPMAAQGLAHASGELAT